MNVSGKSAEPTPVRLKTNPLHVLAHFARILLAAGLLAGVLAPDSPARAQNPPADAKPTPAPMLTGEKIAAHHRAAQRLIHEGKLTEANAELQDALALDPTVGDTHMLLAAVAAKSERWADALASYEKALALGVTRSAVHYGIGVSKRGLNDFPGALAACTKASELAEKELADLHDGIAQLREKASGNKAPAPDSDELEAALRNEQFVVATLTEVNYQLSVIAREMGDDQAEGFALTRGLALNPNHAKLLTEQGAWLLRKGDAPGAVTALEKALTIPGVDLSVVYDLGRALLRIPGREAEGRAKLADYVQRDEARREKVSEERRRGQAASLALRAESELRNGHKEVARDLAARALELDPTNERAKQTATAAAE